MADAPHPYPNIEQHPLLPFLPETAQLLMLGSFPPPKERWCMDFFYPNPQNDMLRIMGQVFFLDKSHFEVQRDNVRDTKRRKAVFNYEAIVSFCRKQGIAIFDTAQAVRRLQGNAADEHLEIVEQTDIAALLQQLPQCHDICCTGGKAAETLAEILHTATPKVGEFIETTFAGRVIRFWRMPSTSRAYPLSFDKKAVAYQRMFKQLPKRRIEVVAAIIYDEAGRVFATQRGYGEWKDWWEFPGGKIEAGETPRQALRREIREELAAEIEVGELLRTIDYDYPAFHLTMHCFMCRLLNREQGTKTAALNEQGTKSKEQGQKTTASLKEQGAKSKDNNSSNSQFTLLEHEAAKWLAPSDLHTVRWLPADKEIIEILQRRRT